MPLIWDVPVVVPAVFFLAALIRGTVGFGDALISMPLLVLFLPVTLAVPVVAFMATTVGAVLLLRQWRQVHRRDALLLILASAPGVPIGAFLLTTLPSVYIKSALALTIGGYGIWGLLRPAPRQPVVRRWTAGFFGFTAGLFGGAYNTNGPPVVIYGTLRAWTPSQFSATMQGYFFPVSLIVLGAHAYNGLWTATVGRSFAVGLPALLLGLMLGQFLQPRLPVRVFRLLILILLILASAVLMADVLLPR